MKHQFYPTVYSSRVETLNQFLSPSGSISLSTKVLSNVDREIAAGFDIDGAIEKAKQQRIDAGFPVNK